MGARASLLLVLLALPASGQEVDWPKELPAAGREALLRDGVWVGPKEFRQVFEAYNNPPCPVFVTTDGPIVAGYRLMERTVMRMERWSFAKLPRGLRELETALGKVEGELKLPAETAAVATRRARLVVAVARLLLGEEPAGLDEATLAQARECAALVEKAEGRSMPPGLGPADPGWLGLDWRVFRPRGPYAGDERTERAFRATRWLQFVPFRLAREDEAAAFDLLRAARGRADFWPSPMWAARLLPVTTHESAFGDDLAGFAHAAQEGNTRIALCIAPRVRLPEDDVFSGLLDPKGRSPVSGAGFPCGLAVAAELGSPLAGQAFAPYGLGPADQTGDTHLRSEWVEASHRMRAALLDAAEPDAPALFSSPAWQRKSLRTALGSWALERNVWTSHAHDVHFGDPKQLPGLVEPDPAAFARLAEVGRCVLKWLEGSELDGEAMRIEYADGVLAYVRGVVASLVDPKGDPTVPSAEELMRTLREWGVLDLAEYDRISAEARRRVGDAALSGGDVKAVMRHDVLDPALAACERWHARMVDLSVKLERPVPGMPLRPEWERWVGLCASLELFAHKQLRQRSWPAAGEWFLREYGVELGEVMGPYVSARNPVDDAPRAAAVIGDPLNDVMCVVGTGRLRELWVLYPHRGKSVVCRGVVLSYYELDAKDAPTDAEWKAMLDSKEPPREPAWLTGE